jgi:hypothetical protein
MPATEAGNQIDVHGLQRLAEQRQQRVRVEPALAAAAIGAGGDAFGRQPGKAPRERRGVLQHDVGAFADLDGVIGGEHRQAVVGGEDEIAVLAEADVGVGAELFFQPPETGRA